MTRVEVIPSRNNFTYSSSPVLVRAECLSAYFTLAFDRPRSVDNSDYMRNGDFLPTRLQAQQDAVNLVCHSKTRSNPENNVGLITLAKYVSYHLFAVSNFFYYIYTCLNSVEVLATLTSDVGRILSKQIGRAHV